MALSARSKIWVNGDVLTASDLNGEINIIRNCLTANVDETNLGTIKYATFSNNTANPTLDVTSTSTGEAVLVRSGGKAHAVNNTGVIEYSGATNPGWISNLGLSLSGGRLKIVDAGGDDLSTTNPGWVTVPSNTAGRLVTLKITVATHLIDDASSGSSDIVGELWNTSTGVAWGNSRPFFVYLVNVDDTDTNAFFAISPNPSESLTPSSSTKIGYHGNPSSANTDFDFFGMTATNVTAYTSKPCVCIGQISATKSVGNDWTFDAITSYTGIGNIIETLNWTMPSGQMGATSGKYMEDNGGTAPVFSTNQYFYKVHKNGLVTIFFRFINDGGTDGAGAVTAYLNLPYICTLGPSDSRFYINTANTGGEYVAFGMTSNGSARLTMYYYSAINAATLIQNSFFPNGVKQLIGSFTYRAF